MDKTGTITEGKPRLVRVHALLSERVLPLRKMFAVIGTAESGSEHPIGAAIATFVKEVTFSVYAKFFYWYSN